MASILKIVHVNLAKGFRGGERQTALLIEGLSSHSNLQQTLVCRKDSPLRQSLSDVPGLSVVSANHQLAGHAAVGPVDIVHAHEAKAVHWACWHHLTRRVPFLLTRRVATPVGDKLSNRWCYRRASHRVAISRAIQQSLTERGWGNVDIVPSAFAGLSHSHDVTQSFRRCFPGRFLVGHAGALVDRIKGQRVLLKAARILEKKVPDMHFVFLGDGEDREELQRESSDLSNVSWLGFKENIGDYLAGMDLFAFPSHNEGLGSVLLDVIDAGVPVVAASVGGIPDIIIDDCTGLLFEDNDHQGLASKLEMLYRSRHLRGKLRSQAKEHIEEFSPEIMARKYYNIYCSSLNYAC